MHRSLSGAKAPTSTLHRESMRGLVGLVVATLVAGTSHAQVTVEGLRSYFYADGTTARCEESTQRTPLLPSAPVAAVVAQNGPLWRQSDNGEGWIGRVVSLGDRGTQLFTEFDTAADRAEIVSTFDSTPVTPLWVLPQIATSQDARVDSAEAGTVHVSCRQIPVSGLTGPRYTYVSCYDALHPSASWTYQFPIASYGPSRAMVSRDGTRIVAGSLDTTGLLHVAVFASGSGTPLYTTALVVGPQLRAFLLSADGTKLYYASGTSCVVWDVDTHVNLANFVLMTSLDSHGMSGDGRVFANGGFNTVDIYERQAAGNYVRTHQMTVPGQAVCTRLAVSENGSTVVAGFNLWDTNLGVRIQALDVPSKTVTMTDVAVGAGTLQNVVSDIAISADGSRFAVGLWGDEAGLVDDLRFYRRDQNAPVASFAYPGSIYAVDMSADGSRVAAGSKAVHANQYAGGGAIDVYAFANEDFAVTGIPGVGDKLHVSLSGWANAPARLLLAPAQGPAPFVTPFGSLYLDRNTMWSVSMGTTDASGAVEVDYNIPPSSTLIGTTLCLQGLTITPRQFTRSWVRMTILP